MWHTHYVRGADKPLCHGERSSGGGRQEAKYSSPPLTAGDTFLDPQWVPETVDSTEPRVYCFSYIYTHL